MHITVGIATWNRARVLRRTLSRLQKLLVPKGVSWELLAVDNNSTDDTQDVLNEFKSLLPLKALFEARQGKSWALNRAVEVAGGEYILWIDDDILADPDWMTEYHRAFLNFPAAGVFGGRIIPSFEGAPPEWLIEALPVIGGVYGMCEPKEGPISTSDPFLPFGGNMAVKSNLQRLFPFDVQLGRQGGKLLAGEESEMTRQMLENGIEGRWVPAARVEHIITPELQTLSHVRRYFHDSGVTSAPRARENGLAWFFAGPRWAWRQAIQCEIRYWLGRVFRRPPTVWMKDFWLASHAWGVLRKRPMRVPRRDSGQARSLSHST